MTVCTATRLLVPALLVSLGVSAVTGNDRYGWIAGGLTVGGLAIVRRLGRAATTCAVAPPQAEPGPSVERGVRRSASPSTGNSSPPSPKARRSG